MTQDLYRDGWTVPKVVAKIRVFAAPGGKKPTMRFLTISVRGPNDVPPRPFRIVSNQQWAARAGEHPTSNQISVCVPARGFRRRADPRTPLLTDLRGSEERGELRQLRALRRRPRDGHCARRRDGALLGPYVEHAENVRRLTPSPPPKGLGLRSE